MDETGRKNFLEGHLAPALLHADRQRKFQTSRPQFPPPVPVERADSSTNDNPWDHRNKYFVIDITEVTNAESSPSTTNPYVGASATTSSTRTYVHSTKNEDLNDYLDPPDIVSIQSINYNLCFVHFDSGSKSAFVGGPDQSREMFRDFTGNYQDLVLWVYNRQ